MSSDWDAQNDFLLPHDLGQLGPRATCLSYCTRLVRESGRWNYLKGDSQYPQKRKPERTSPTFSWPQVRKCSLSSAQW